MKDDLLVAIADLEEEAALKILNDKLNRGEDPYKILEVARAAMEVVGSRFTSGECFLSVPVILEVWFARERVGGK